MCFKHAHTLNYLIYGENIEFKRDDCFEWYSYLYTNLMLGVLLWGNLFSLTVMLKHNGNETNDCAKVLPKTYGLAVLKAAP